MESSLTASEGKIMGLFRKRESKREIEELKRSTLSAMDEVIDTLNTNNRGLNKLNKELEERQDIAYTVFRAMNSEKRKTK
jgi:hypothetical protein